MGKGSCNFLKEVFMKEIFLIIKFKVKVNIYDPMEENTKDND